MSQVHQTNERFTQPSRDELEAFLFHEARLLDEQRFQDWGKLFAPDGIYWIPAAHGQSDPLDHVSHIYEDRLLREIRIERFSNENAFSLQPMPRSSHLISNVMLDDFDAVSGLLTSSCRFIVTQFHRDSVTHFAGGCVHQLMATGAGFQIKRKRVDLVNCDGMLGDIVLYL